MSRDVDEDRAFVAEAERRGYRGVVLVNGVWCASASSTPDWAAEAPAGAPAGLKAIPGTDQTSIGRAVERMAEAS